jgi:post-segregation antitoxin (ccd killing protein)
MRMARVNVYLPDELAREARAAGLNISRLAQEALSENLAQSKTDRWLDGLEGLPRVNVPHVSVMQALDEAREDLADRAGP